MNLETPWSLSSSWTLQTITSSTGHLIRLGIWQAQESKNASPGKTVYFINGRNEFIEKNSKVMISLPPCSLYIGQKLKHSI